MNLLPFHQFISFYASLPMEEKYKLSQAFHLHTGGKLSPHNNPTPVVVGLVPIETDEGIKLLGLKRGIPPHVGGTALPGGFQEAMESPQQALSREIKEETGLDTYPSHFQIFGNPLPSPTNNLLLFYAYDQTLTMDDFLSLKIQPETEGFILIDAHTTLCFPLHQEKTQQFFKPLQSEKHLKP